MNRGCQNMAFFDKWPAEDIYNCHQSKAQELDFDVEHWPQPLSGKFKTLRLEELTHYEIEKRIRARNRNMARLDLARSRSDVIHLDCHYTCCVDIIQRKAIESLVGMSDRGWGSFTMMGINGIGDMYSTSMTSEALYPLFLALQNFQMLNLHSCTMNRSHGLECILKAIPYFRNLRVLRLEGWQMDRITATTLVESLQFQHKKTISYLSMRSCLFLGEDTFSKVSNGLLRIPQLKAINMSYCNLGDNEIILLVDSLKRHRNITHVHIGGNSCRSSSSIDAIVGWIEGASCMVQDLNLRSVLVGFSDHGLYQRLVDTGRLLRAFSLNKSLRSLSLSENCLDDSDIRDISKALLSRKSKTLRNLDVGDNPFEEQGAMCLVHLVRGLQTLHQIRFENHFVSYRSSELIKLIAEYNKYDQRLVDAPLNVPISLWPHALARVQYSENQDDVSPNRRRAANHMFRLLRCKTGPYGHELSWRISEHNLRNNSS